MFAGRPQCYASTAAGRCGFGLLDEALTGPAITEALRPAIGEDALWGGKGLVAAVAHSLGLDSLVFDSRTTTLQPELSAMLEAFLARNYGWCNAAGDAALSVACAVDPFSPQTAAASLCPGTNVRVLVAYPVGAGSPATILWGPLIGQGGEAGCTEIAADS